MKNEKNTGMLSYNGYEIADNKLAKITNKILTLVEKIKGNYYTIGTELIKIRDNELYKNTGDPEIKTFIGYCEKVLCLSRATTYRIISTTEKVFIPLKETYPWILKLPDVALSKLTTLNNSEELIDFIATKEITSTHTVREIDALLKEYRAEKNTKSESESHGVETYDDPTIETHESEVIEAKKIASEIRENMHENWPDYPSEDIGEKHAKVVPDYPSEDIGEKHAKVVLENVDEEFINSLKTLLRDLYDNGIDENRGLINSFSYRWFDEGIDTIRDNV